MTTSANIVFMQGTEADEVLNDLLNVEYENDLAVIHGPTDKSIASAVEHLRQWETGEEKFDVHGFGTNDHQVEHDGYVLVWNYNLQYVGLYRLSEGE